MLDLPRTGKAGALNTAVERATGEILVFSDANSMFAPDALARLAAPFADPSVGGVAGDQRYLPDDGDGGVAKGERGYWDLDRAIKQAESAAGNVISATGAIYAVRRSLFGPVPDGVTDDFATSTAVIAQGHRLVFAPDAVAYEPVGAAAEIEYGRKVRVMTRGLNGVVLRRGLLDPRRHGFYAVQLFSHKVLRRLMAIPLLMLAGHTAAPRPPLAVLPRGWRPPSARLYGLGAAGLRSGEAPSPATGCSHCLHTSASSTSRPCRPLANVVRRRSVNRWEPRREDA